MTEAEARAAVVAEARSWAGTKYVHMADIKRAGVDCALLLVRCFVDTGLVPPFDPRPYSRTWFLHRTEERYLDFVSARAVEIDGPPGPGDIVLWQVGRLWAHAGIVTEWSRIVHAYAKAGMVIESDVSLPGVASQDRHGQPRKTRFFSLWG